MHVHASVVIRKFNERQHAQPFVAIGYSVKLAFYISPFPLHVLATAALAMYLRSFQYRDDDQVVITFITFVTYFCLQLV